MKEEVEELYAAGLASHGGPEPCGHTRKGVFEALKRVRPDELLSLDIGFDRSADAVETAEGNIVGGVIASR